MDNKTAEEILLFKSQLCGVEENTALKMAYNALKKEDEYKWHNLKINPDDLPEDDVEVNICYGENHMYAAAHYDSSHAWSDYVWSNKTCRFTDVIAWKYIEPFEEVE